MSKDYNLKIYTEKTKIMAFKRKHSVRSKTEVDRTILEQVKQFNYLGCELSLEGEPDFIRKLTDSNTYAAFKEKPYRYPNEIL
jgi:hypothetical protein